MLRKAMVINPGFLGGVGSQGHFSKLKNWFYYGWKKRFKLSTRKISSCGQKLPRDWQAKVANIIARISKGQMPHQRMDGSFCPGADDDHVINSDQVPVWIESHSSTQWGDRENHKRRNVKTGGKEKDRFTVQLSVSKSGKKVSKKRFIFCVFHSILCN